MLEKTKLMFLVVNKFINIRYFKLQCFQEHSASFIFPIVTLVYAPCKIISKLRTKDKTQWIIHSAQIIFKTQFVWTISSKLSNTQLPY